MALPREALDFTLEKNCNKRKITKSFIGKGNFDQHSSN